jgi:hypothetical protein
MNSSGEFGLGSVVQAVLRAKDKGMASQSARRLRAALAPATDEVVG